MNKRQFLKSYRSIICLFSIVAFLSSSIVFGQASKMLDTYISEGISQAKVPGLTALIVKDKTIIWEGSYGFANIEEKRKVTPETLFQIASVSKTITACAIMSEVEKNRLNLDHDINKILPFPVRNPAHPNQVITLRQLLTHTSGIRDNWKVLEDTWVKNRDFPESLAQSLKGYFSKNGQYYHPSKNYYKWAPGTKDEYSNVGTALAAYAAEITSRQSFEKLCESQIFAPLQIKGSSFRLADVDQNRLAMPYEFRKKTSTFKALGHHGYLDFPAGSLRITARDLAKFLTMFINDGRWGEKQILKAETVREMKRIQFPNIDSSQGLLWYHEKLDKNLMIGHDGGDPGVATMMFADPQTGIGFIVLMNAEPKDEKFNNKLTRQLLIHARKNW